MEEKLSQKTAQHPFKYRSVSASSVTEQKQPLTPNKTLPLANRQLSVEEENVLKNFSIPNSMKWKLFFALLAFSCALHRSPANKAKCSENSAQRDKRASSQLLLFLIWAYNSTIQFGLNTVFIKTIAVPLLNHLMQTVTSYRQILHLSCWGLLWALRKAKSKPTIKPLLAWHSAALIFCVCASGKPP